MLNTLGTRVNSGCYDNRHWKFKNPAAGSIPSLDGYFTLKLHTTATFSWNILDRHTYKPSFIRQFN